jgi:hypothetical protein
MYLLGEREAPGFQGLFCRNESPPLSLIPGFAAWNFGNAQAFTRSHVLNVKPFRP